MTIKTIFDGYGKENVERDIGTSYTVVLWHEQAGSVRSKVSVKGMNDPSIDWDLDSNAVIITVPVEVDRPEAGITIEQCYHETSQGKHQ